MYIWLHILCRRNRNITSLRDASTRYVTNAASETRGDSTPLDAPETGASDFCGWRMRAKVPFAMNVMTLTNVMTKDVMT